MDELVEHKVNEMIEKMKMKQEILQLKLLKKLLFTIKHLLILLMKNILIFLLKKDKKLLIK